MSLWIKQKWFHVNFFSVVNDFDEETERKISVEHREEYLAKVAHRVQNYEVKILNELRENKKLLVLDIDYTLFDHKTPAETGAELMRPHLHDFLTSAYKVSWKKISWSQLSNDFTKIRKVVSHKFREINFLSPQCGKVL